MKSKKTIVKVKDLVKTYVSGKVKTYAVRGVSFEIHKGEFVALSGPSGSGKSTILYQLGLLDSPTSGKIIIDNKNIAKLSNKEKSDFRLKKVGYVFQNYELLPELTALENVYLPIMPFSREAQCRCLDKFEKACGCEPEKGCGCKTGEKCECNISEKNKDPKERIIKALEQVGLKERENHYPSELSGGEQQRVSIARALVNNPTVIFADEPTANLDSVRGKQIMEILRDLSKKNNQTILVVNHEKTFERYFDKIIRIKDGKIIKIEAKTKISKTYRKT